VAKHWESKAVKPANRGKFSAKAKAAGYTVHEYALKEEHAPGKLGEEARFALTMEKEARKHGAKQ
jgi:hypothetical protein